MPPADRYRRQSILPAIGLDGQTRLGRSRAVVVGIGALGTVSAELLARAGVGTLRLIDRDLVEVTNLQRQVLFAEGDEGRPKAAAAAARLGAINSSINIEPIVADLTGANAQSLLGLDSGSAPGVLIDGTDNFETRFLLNDVAVKHAIPYVYGGAIGTRGMAGVFATADGPCLRCVFDSPPPPGSQPTCETAGVLAPASAMVGAWQAAAAMRLLLGIAEGGALAEFDPWNGLLRTLDVTRLEGCPCCGQRRFEFLDAHASPATAALCGRDAVQIGADAGVDLTALAARLAPLGEFSVGPFMLTGDVEGGRYTLTVFADGRAIVRGTRDPAEARSVWARYVGA